MADVQVMADGLDWKQDTFGMCKDPKGDVYSTYCNPCMICEIAPDLGLEETHSATAGNIGKLCLAYYCCPFAFCMCKEYIYPCWVSAAIDKAQEKYGLKPQAPLGDQGK